MSFRTVPLRTGLGLTILLMGAFSILLVAVSERIYRTHAIENQRIALAEVIRIKSNDLLGELVRHAARLGLEIQQDPAFRSALKQGDQPALQTLLDNRFQQYFVTADILKLEKLQVYDSDFQPVAASGKGMHMPVSPLDCPNLLETARQRTGSDRLKPASRLCTRDHLPYLAVMVPIGLRPDGYIHVVTNPEHDLKQLEQSLGMPLQLTRSDESVSYQSSAWKEHASDRDALDISYTLASDIESDIVTASLRMNLQEFFTNLRRTRDLVMLMVGVVTILTALLARLLTERLMVRPLQALCNQLRRRDRRLIGEAPDASNHRISEFAELKELYGVLEEISLTDSLTGLANRIHFEQRLEALLLPDNEQRQHAICYLDLDHFKIVNDTCGHIAGDQLLQQISQLFRATVRSNDLVARIGGDEFAILLEDCPANDARSIAAKLNDAISSFEFTRDGRSFHIGVSIGVVPFDNGSRLDDLIGAADTACYLAKESGRNRTYFSRPDAVELLQRRDETRWANRITAALDNNRFELLAQPIHPAIVGGQQEKLREILLCMLDEEGNRISPGDFIPAAERYQLMPAIDRWVIRNLSRQLETIQASELPHSYCVNLSGQSIADDNFLHFLIDSLDSSRIPADRLVFEITEPAALSGLNKVARVISILKGLGIRFALDDFGSGLSSFTHLKVLSVDYVKIDGSFICGMAGNSVDQRMVEAIHQMACAMNIQTIAESVENEVTYSLLQDIGVNYLQGYYIGRPLPLAGVLQQDITTTDGSAKIIPIRQ